MNQNILFGDERLYCKSCKEMTIIKIPKDVDLSSPTSETFVRNLRCANCKNIGSVRR
jgi:hypothetical protein